MNDLPRRKPTRRRKFDYSLPGRYFVTPVVQNRLHLFGEVIEGEMRLNPAGEMIEKWWLELSSKFDRVELHQYVVMPNHFHGIIELRPAEKTNDSSLPDVMDWFKTMTTNAYIRGVKQENWRRFDGKLWQRSFYDHVIRRDNAFERIAWYIEHNPGRWHLDRENTHRFRDDEFDRWLESDAATGGDDSGE